MIRAALLLALALGLAAAFLEHVAAASPLTVRVRPERFGFFGSDLQIQIRVLVDPELQGRRRLEVLVDGPQWHRTNRTVHEQLSTQTPIWIKTPPPGAYAITVALLECSEDGCGNMIEAAKFRHTTEIFGPGYERDAGAAFARRSRFWSR